VQGSVEEGQPFVDKDVYRVLGLAGLVQPARRFVLVGKWSEGADRGCPGQGQGRRLVVDLDLDPPRPSPPPAAGRCAERLQDKNALPALAPARPRQVAAVGEWQRPGEVELDESE
jgi:hypothetical protein